MTEPRLQISPDYSLPLNAVTGTHALLAKRGAGKTNAGVVMAEEMWDHGLAWVAIDPVGSWWGIRAEGVAPGLPVLVFGGRHGDLPLEPHSGRLIADLVIDQNLSCADLAAVDLEALRAAMAAGLDQAAGDDPELLRKRIEQLELELAETETKAMQTPVLTEGDRAALASGTSALSSTLEVMGGSAQDILTRLEALVGRIDARLDPLTGPAATAGGVTLARGHPAGPGHRPPVAAKEGGAGQAGSSAASQSPDRLANGTAPGTAEPQREDPAGSAGDAPRGPAGPLTKAERSVLTVLASGERTKLQLGMLSGYSAAGGAFQRALGHLRSLGYITGHGVLWITEEGRAAAGEVEPLPTGRALVEHWMRRLNRAESAVLERLLEVYPGARTKQELADWTRYAADGGAFQRALGHLRTLQLITGTREMVANDELGRAAREDGR